MVGHPAKQMLGETLVFVELKLCCVLGNHNWHCTWTHLVPHHQHPVNGGRVGGGAHPLGIHS